MFSLGLICRDTFRRVIRNKTTEQFSGLPYIYALLNCLICLWYGTPLTFTPLICSISVSLHLALHNICWKGEKGGYSFVYNMCWTMSLWMMGVCERSNLLKYSLHAVTDKNARIVAWSIWPFYSYCYWELTNHWPPLATECCRDFELCISRINVLLSLVYYCKSIFKLLFYLYCWTF